LSNRFHEIKVGRSNAYISETLHVEQKHQEIWDHRIQKSWKSNFGKSCNHQRTHSHQCLSDS
jgi:hypothetical protein